MTRREGIKPVSYRIPDDVKDRLKAFAQQDERTVNSALVLLLRRALDALDQAKGQAGR